MRLYPGGCSGCMQKSETAPPRQGLREESSTFFITHFINSIPFFLAFVKKQIEFIRKNPSYDVIGGNIVEFDDLTNNFDYSF